jgi:hypothetical protein
MTEAGEDGRVNAFKIIFSIVLNVTDNNASGTLIFDQQLFFVSRD